MEKKVAVEDGLAMRIEQLRTAEGWSYSELSRRMGEAGCPIERSSLQKIEKGSPRRKIGVNELVAFTTVFNKNFAEILLTPAEVSRIAYGRDVKDIRAVSWAKIEADQRHEALIERLVAACLEDDEGPERLRDLLAERHEIETKLDPEDSVAYPVLVAVTDRVRAAQEEG